MDLVLVQQPKQKKRRKERVNPLTWLDEGIFVSKVLGYVDQKDVERIFRVGPIALRFRLELHYCILHHTELDPIGEPMENLPVTSDNKGQSNPKDDDDDSSSSSSEEEGEGADPFTISWKEWRREHPYENPHRCEECLNALNKVEECPICKKLMDWNDFVHCRECDEKACVECIMDYQERFPACQYCGRRCCWKILAANQGCHQPVPECYSWCCLLFTK
jgi:hypothetical protein